MDPLSISVSILAIISAASFIIKTIKDIEDAPTELIQIADAANALEASLEHVRKCYTTSHKLTEGLAFHLQRSEQKLLELTTYLQENGLTNAKKLRSPVYYIRHQDKLKTYKQHLSDIRSDLVLALAAVNYGQTGRIEMDLQQLVLFGKTVAQTLDDSTLRLGTLEKKTEEVQLAQDQMAQFLQMAGEESKEQIADLNQPQASSVVHLRHSIQMDQEIRYESRQRLPSFNLASRREPNRRDDPQCSSACRCSCHKKRRLATPHSAQDWVGGLSVVFSGIGPLSSACTIASCLRNLNPSASVDFRLPSWLASSMVSIWLKAAPIQGPELLLRSRRIIETAAYYTAEQGNIVGLRQLYTEGRAGIHDVNPLSGRNTLFDSVFRGHLHIVRYLLDSGADMEAADFCGFTPRDLAFQRVNTACPSSLAEELHLLFKLDEVPADLEFTTAHRIVLGMSKLDLEAYLLEHPGDVNNPDLLGRTPLWWAVRRDDTPISLALLDHGGDPNISNTAGRSPLHNAAAQGNHALVDALLAHNADVHQKSFEGKTPLQVVGVYGVEEDVLIVKRLLAAGASMDEQDGYGRTSISLCCFDSHLGIARALLEQGVDVSIADGKGWLPWHWAVYDGAAEIVGLYLDHGCDLSAVIEGATTALHFVAERCAAEQVADVLLAKADLSHVDPAAKNTTGKIAMEILEDRHATDVPVFPLDEAVYFKLKRLIEGAGIPADVASSASSPLSMADSWHSAEQWEEPG
ncbi:hypothetical protein N0V82_002776 [Gnomoniopsis sp. IMI 355080]|nr:hypothetical protein N0V82_002776 [Gnomoniopsis sp. IMI 355080]